MLERTRKRETPAGYRRDEDSDERAQRRPSRRGGLRSVGGCGRTRPPPSEIATIVGRKALEYVKAFSNQGSNASEILASDKDRASRRRPAPAMRTQRRARVGHEVPPGMLEELAPQIVDDLVEASTAAVRGLFIL